jgi:hypothetical protein
MNKKNLLYCLTVFLVSFSTTTFVGCGESKWPPTYKSGGTVKLDGSPVEGALVSFHPLDGQNAANARTDASGSYELTSFNAGDGATPGSFGVAIKKLPFIDIDAVPGGRPFEEGMNTEPGAEPVFDAGPENELPEKYSDQQNSGLSATVTADGENIFNFNLTSE